jgi:hypothetical protein
VLHVPIWYDYQLDAWFCACGEFVSTEKDFVWLVARRRHDLVVPGA